MIQKNRQLSLLDNNPKLPGKRTDAPDKSSEGGQWRPLENFLLWCQDLLWRRPRSAVETTASEREEIEARVRNELYPKKVKR